MQQRVRLCSGNERAVAIVVAVRENLGRDLQPQFFRRLKQLGPSGREQDCASINGEHPVRDRIGQFTITHRHIIEGAVRLDMVHLHPRRGAKGLKGPDLIGNERVSLRRTHLHFSSPKIFSIVETWVRPYCDTFLFCRANGIEN